MCYNNLIIATEKKLDVTKLGLIYLVTRQLARAQLARAQLARHNSPWDNSPEHNWPEHNWPELGEIKYIKIKEIDWIIG